MTAANLLTQARADGLTLRLDPPDRLKLAGAPTAVAKWAPILRPHKPELVRLLADHQAAVKEAQAERAAIAEYLGGLPRGRAEAVAELAGAFYSHHWICPICRHGTSPAPGCTRHARREPGCGIGTARPRAGRCAHDHSPQPMGRYSHPAP